MANKLWARLSWLRHRSPIDAALYLLLLAVGVSVVASPFPKQAVIGSLPLLIGMALCWLLARWPARAALQRHVWWGLIAYGVLVSFMALPGTLAPDHIVFRMFPIWRWVRDALPKTFNENVIAGTLVLVTPFAVGRALVEWQQRVAFRRRRWLIAALASLFLLLSLWLIDSNGAYLGVAGALLMLAVLIWPRFMSWVLLMALIAGVVSYIVGWRPSPDDLLFGATRILRQREEIWSRALLVIQDFPLTGVGSGGFEPIVKRYYQLFTISKGTVSHAHNLFLQVAVDLGIPGLITFLAILGFSCYSLGRAYKAFRQQKRFDLMLLAASALTALVGMCIHGLLDAAVWDNRGAFLPWVILGLSMMLDRLRRESGPPDDA